MPTAATDRTGAVRAFVAVTALVLLAGCGALDWVEPRAPTWVELRGVRSSAPPREPVHRLLVLPFRIGDALPSQADALRAALAQSFRDSCGFDVVAPTDTELPRTTRDQVASGGGRDAAGLIRLHREWGADAVLFGRLAFGRAHGDPAVGLELELIDARDGAQLWFAKDAVDTRDPATRSALLSWRRSESGHDEDPGTAAQVPLDSFARFVAASFVRTLFRVEGSNGNDGTGDSAGAGRKAEKAAQALDESSE